MQKMTGFIDWSLWGLLLIAATLELIGDLALKWWAETNRWLGLGIGLIVYGLALIIFAALLRRAKLIVIFALWVGVAAVLLALAGWWLFGESLSLRHLAGLGLVIGGMILLRM
jgi:multidrug transporter EmrE-like cation transporter